MDVSISLESVRRDIREAEERLAKLRAVEEYIVQHVVSKNGRLLKSKTGTQTTGQAAIAQKALTALGRPAKTAEIVALALKEGLLKQAGKLRNLENAVYGSMARRKDTFCVERGTWELVSRKK